MRIIYFDLDCLQLDYQEKMAKPHAIVDPLQRVLEARKVDPTTR